MLAAVILGSACTDLAQPQADAQERIDALSGLELFGDEVLPGWVASDLRTRIGTVGGRNATGSSSVTRSWNPTSTDSNEQAALVTLAEQARIEGYSSEGCPPQSDPASTVLLKYAGTNELLESIVTLRAEPDGNILIFAIAASGACRP